MPSQSQKTVDTQVTNKSLGSSSTTDMQESYPSSPIHNGDLTPAKVKKEFEKLVMNGKVLDGLGIPEFSRDFEGAPNLKKVKTGGGGLPASPFVPNPTSPGPGSQNPTDQPKPPTGFGTQPNSDNYGSGLGASESPSATSKQYKNRKLGSFGLGTSANQK